MLGGSSLGEQHGGLACNCSVQLVPHAGALWTSGHGSEFRERLSLLNAGLALAGGLDQVAGQEEARLASLKGGFARHMAQNGRRKRQKVSSPDSDSSSSQG